MLLSSLVKSQSIVGGAGVCAVNANPNSISSMDTRDPKDECLRAINHNTGQTWRYDNSQIIGNRWINEIDGNGMYGGSGTVPSSTVITLTDKLEIDGALNIADSSDNTFLGENTGDLTTSAQNNISVGFDSGKSLTSGSNNTFFGYEAGRNINSGGDNIMLGNGAGKINTVGSNNIFIGNNSSFNGATSNSNKLVIGHGSFPLLSGDLTTGTFKVDGTSEFTSDIELDGYIKDASGNLGTNGQFLGRDANGVKWQDAGGGTADGVVTGFTTNTAGNATRGVQRSIGSTLSLNIEDGDSDDQNELDGDGIYAGSGTVPSSTVTTLANTSFGAWKIDNTDIEVGLNGSYWQIQESGTTEKVRMGFLGAQNAAIVSDKKLSIYGNSSGPGIILDDSEVKLAHKIIDGTNDSGNEGDVLTADAFGKVDWQKPFTPEYGGLITNATTSAITTGDTNQHVFDWTSQGFPESSGLVDDTTADKITINETGVYRVNVTLALSGDASGKIRAMIYEGTGYQADYWITLQGMDKESHSFSRLINITTSDIPADIEIRYEQGTNIAPNVDTMESTSTFEIVKISEL